MDNPILRRRLIRLAYQRPDLRPEILPLITEKVGARPPLSDSPEPLIQAAIRSLVTARIKANDRVWRLGANPNLKRDADGWEDVEATLDGIVKTLTKTLREVRSLGAIR